MGTLWTMVTVTADDIRVLARDSSADATLVVRNGRVEVVSGGQAGDERIVYTKAALIEEYGEDVTDVEAELAAGHLTAQLAG
jgi:hypothetical protein